MQRSFVLFLLFVAIAVLGGWLWWSSDDVLPPPEPPPITPNQANSPSPPVATPGPGAPQTPDPVPPTGVRVRVEVLARERFVPPPVSRVLARQKVDGAPLPAHVLAGAGAGFDAAATAANAGTALVAIDTGAGRAVRSVALTAGEPVVYEVAGSLAVRGTVRGADGLPLRDARVWFGEYGADGQRLEALTDATGEYELPVLAGPGVPCVVQAPGHAIAARTLVVAAPPPVVDVQLQPGCTIDVQVAGFARAMTTARAFVLPRGVVATELAQWPFWLQALDGGVALDAAGRASIPGLPRAGEVAVLVRHPEAPLGAGVPVVLKGERARASVPLAYAPSTRTGRVLDGERRPLAGAWLWAASGAVQLGDGNSQRLLPPHLEVRGTATTTAADGAFAIGLPGDAANARVLVHCAGHAGREFEAGALVDGGELVLPAWVGGEPQFTLQPPAAGVAWTADCDLSGGVRERLDAGQSFRLSLPYAGRFSFVLTLFDGADVVAVRTLADVDVTGPIELESPKRP
jgi:hypothetical protein